MWKYLAGTCVLAAGAGVAGASVGPTWTLLTLAGIAIVAVAVKYARALPPVLLLAAFPLARPNIFGEYLSLAAALILAAGALICVMERGGAVALGERRNRPLRSPYLWLGAAYLWLLVQGVLVNSTVRTPAVLVLQGGAITLVSVVSAAVILSEGRYRRTVCRGFVVIIAVLCASYVVTAGIWAIAGVGSARVAMIPVGSLGQGPVYFPFTSTSGTQTVYSLSLPRFTGIGREPGWMAMYAAFAYFVAPRVGLGRWWVKITLVIGLLGCVSSAGFGVFVLVWAYEVFLRPRRPGVLSLAAYLRQFFGLGVTAGAIWVAVTAPVLGLAAKSQQNAVSLADRTQATQRGLDALLHSPIIGEPQPSGSVNVGGINLIASIAGSGVPYVVLILAALLMARRTHPFRALTTAPIAVLVATLITSQPPGNATWVFVAALVAYAVTIPPSEVEVADSFDLDPGVKSRIPG